MKKKQTSSTIERKKEVLANLTKFGDTLYDQIEKGTFPWIKMPSRSIDNITITQNYDNTFWETKP